MPRRPARRRGVRPLDSIAFFFAIDRPSPMPCFLKVMVGSNSVADAAALSPGPESCTSMSTWHRWTR